MFCSNCGKEIPDGSKFCNFCGTTMGVQTNAAEVAEVTTETQVAAPEVKQKKKMGLGAKIAIIAASLIAIVGVGVLGAFVFARDKVEQVVRSNFDKPKDYYSYVEKKGYKALAGASATENLANVVKQISNDNVSFKESVQITVGSKGKDLMSLASLLGVDVDWFNNVGLQYEGTIQKDKMKFSVAPVLNDVQLMTAVMLLNVKDGVFLATIPEFTNQYIGVNMGEGFSDQLEEAMEEFGVVSEGFQKMFDAIPSQEEIDELVIRYFDLIMDQVDDVKKEKAKLSVSGIEQSCTMFTIDLDSKDVQKVATAVLKEVKNDKTIKNMLEKYFEAFEMELGDDYDFYSDFQDSIDEAIDEVEDIDIEKLIVNTYVDRDGNVIGRRITVKNDGEEVIAFVAKTTKGSEYGYEFSVEADDEVQFAFTGNGETKNDVFSGDFELEVEGENILRIDVDEYDVKAEKEGNFACKLTIKPGRDVDVSQLIEDAFGMNLDSSAKLLLTTLDPAISFTLKLKEEQHEFEIALMDHKDEIIVFSFKGSMEEAKDIEFPASYVAIDADGNYDEDELLDFLKGMDLDVLTKNLKKANLPDEWLDYVEEAIDYYYLNIR